MARTMNTKPLVPGAREVPRPGSEHKVLVEHLRSNGLKMTRERQVILDEVLGLDGHFRPDDLLVRLHSRKIPVSRATIYRALDLLVGAGLVHRETFRERGALYEKTHRVQGHNHHDHLHCTFCDSLIEFHNEEIERLQEKVCRQFGFQAQSHSHQIQGICRKCLPKVRSGQGTEQ